MNDDLIERAAQVVRERYDGESQLAARSEERILQASHRRSPPRRRPAVIAIPLVAALLASAAWATVGDKLRALVHSIDSASSVSLHPAPKPSGHLRLPPRLPPERVAPPLEPTAPLLEPSAPASATPIARAAQHAPAVGKAASLPPPPLPAPSPNSSELEITEMYRAAHHAQFAGGDPGRALELWDRYL